MSVIQSANNGNWSNTSTWTGGTIPGNGDSAVINHLVTVDVNATIGSSSTAYSSTGLNNFAIVVNSPWPYGANLYNASISPYFMNIPGTIAGLIIAANVALTVRGDTVLNGSPITLNQGSSYLFDSSQASSPSSTSYVLEILNGGNIGAQLISNGVSGNRATIAAVTGGTYGRITSGQKVQGYSGYDCGIVVAQYTNFKKIGNSSHFAITHRISGGSYIWTLDHCKFDTCGRITSDTASVVNNASFQYTYNTFINSQDAQYPTINSVYSGLCVSFSGNGGSLEAGYFRKIIGNYFDIPIWIQGLDKVFIQDNILIGGWVYVAPNTNGTMDGNLIYIGEGYQGGGGLGVGHGWTYSNNYYVMDSSQNVNTHYIGIGAETGTTYCIGNIFDLEKCPYGMYGGNSFIYGGAANSGDKSTNVIITKNNIVLPAGNTTSLGVGYYAAGSGTVTGSLLGTGIGDYIPAGTLITLLNTQSSQNFSITVENNTAAIPNGIGSIDPDENGPSLVEIWNSVKNNLFWQDPTRFGKGFSMWWNTNSHAITGNINEILSSNLDYNCQYGAKTNTSCYVGLSTASFNPTYAVATPGYQDGFFSSGTPGTHDMIGVNPKFNNYNVNILTFDTSNGGPGTTNSVLNNLQKKNDDSGYNSNYSISNLLKYVRTGFTPTNLSLKNAGYNGLDIGATSVVPSISNSVITIQWWG